MAINASKAANRAYGSGRVQVFLGTLQCFGNMISMGEQIEKQEPIYRFGSRIPVAFSQGLYKADDVALTVGLAPWQKDVLDNMPANGYGDVVFQVTIYNEEPGLGFHQKQGVDCQIFKYGDKNEMNGGEVQCDIGIRARYWIVDGKRLASSEDAGTESPLGDSGFVQATASATATFVF